MPLQFIQQLKAVFQDPDWRHAVKWFATAMLVGVVAGIGAIVFQSLSHSLLNLGLGDLAGYHPSGPGGEAQEQHGSPDLILWLLIALPAAGGLLSGLIVFRYAPEAEGHGTDAALEAYHRKGGIIPWRVPVVKTIASILTLGTGGSGGREGPIAQIGAGFGSLIATKLGLSAKERRILIAAGIGAGVGAIFRAPLAGALFAAEIHYRDSEFEAEAIVPSAIASITSYCVFSLAFGWEALFTAGDFRFHNPLELLPYTGLALAVSVGAIAFVRIFYGLRDVFHLIRIPPSLKPALGAALSGAVAILLYFAVGDKEVLSVLAFGYGTLQGALDGKVALVALLVVAVGKMVTTGLTIGSGGSGGVFGPSMVIGGCIGGAVGIVFHHFFPELVPHPGAYVVVGMAGFFAGAANTPISTIIMVSELTGHYELLLPSLWVCIICYLLLSNTSLYEKQEKSKMDSPAHRGDFHFDVLENMTVGDVVDNAPKSTILTFRESTSLGDIVHGISSTRQHYFPILDSADKLKGVLSFDDIREYLYEDELWGLAVAIDVATTQLVRVSRGDDLTTAMRYFTQRSIDELPVVDENDPNKLVAILKRKDVLDTYNRETWRRHEEGRL